MINTTFEILDVQIGNHMVSMWGDLEMEVEPAQHGGRVDPSWDAFCYPEEAKITSICLDGKRELSKGDRHFDRVIGIDAIQCFIAGYEFEDECEKATAGLERSQYDY